MEKETSMTEDAAVESMIPIRIKNSDLSDDAKRLWCRCARWGSANGKLFAKHPPPERRWVTFRLKVGVAAQAACSCPAHSRLKAWWAL